MNKTPILTTGLTGLVGSRIAELLSDKYEFFNMDLTVGVDITQYDQLEEFIAQHPASVMIHLAAYTDVNGAYAQTNDKSGVCYQVNVEGTKNITQLCAKNNIYLIHISTDFVFAGDQDEPYVESNPRQPIEWYGQTKAWAEEEVEKSTADYVIARIGYPFRAEFAAKPDIVAKTKQGITDGTIYPQFTDMIITPTYVDDLARVVNLLIQQKPQGIFHLNGSSWVSPYEIAQKVAAVFELDPAVIKKGSLEEYLKTTERPYQKTLRIDNQKIQQQLGIKLLTFDEALADIKHQLDEII